MNRRDLINRMDSLRTLLKADADLSARRGIYKGPAGTVVLITAPPGQRIRGAEPTTTPSINWTGVIVGAIAGFVVTSFLERGKR